MLSKFGIRTKLDGNWLNQNNADKVFNILKPYDIDVSRLTVKQNYGTEEIVITDKDSRTVFGNYAKFHSGEKQWNTPQEIDIQNAVACFFGPISQGGLFTRRTNVCAAYETVRHDRLHV